MSLVQAGARLGQAPSPLAPRGDEAAHIAALTWWTIAIAAAIGLLVLVLMIVPLVRSRRAAGEPDPLTLTPDARPVRASMWIGGGGIALTGAILFAVFIATLVTMRRLDAKRRDAALEIQLIAHQWWWEVRYPGRGIVTANELHLPVGGRAHVSLASGDVIHSLWVPQLGGKTDLIPGQANDAWLEADRPGRYQGMCAEYCGRQHAHMDLLVIAEAPDAFAAWLAREAGPAATPADSFAAVGRRVLLASACPACHTIRGTAAAGTDAPDLTHVGSRSTIAAGALPNTPGNLAGWIDNPGNIKPGTSMPAVPLTGVQMRAVLAYLESLK